MPGLTTSHISYTVGKVFSSASGRYVATYGTWSTGEGTYRIQTAADAHATGYRSPIADVWSIEQAQTLLDALDAKDALKAVRAELATAKRDYVILANAVDTQSFYSRLMGLLGR